MSDVTKFKDAAASANTGTDVNQEAWMATWCSAGWATLLQPAPLSIALLGAVMVVASGAKDFREFRLISDIPKDAPDFKWTYCKHPDSFKACLMQMVGDGNTAFITAHTSMMTIRELTAVMPGNIKELVKILGSNDTPENIKMDLDDATKDLKNLARKCQVAAEKCEFGFRDLSNLTQEIILASTFKAGTSEQAFERNKVALAVLADDKKGTEAQIEMSKELLETMKKGFVDAQDEFKKAVDEVPSGMDLLGMDIVQGLADGLAAVGNALTTVATLPKKILSGFKDENGGNNNQGSGNQDQPPPKDDEPAAPAPNPEALRDPALPLVKTFLDMARFINTMLTSPSDPAKADWNLIVSTSILGITGKQGGQYVKSTLEKKKDKCDTSLPISADAVPLVDKLLEILGELMLSGRSGGNDRPVPGYRVSVLDIIDKLQTLNQKALLISNSPGSSSKGFTKPKDNGKTSSSAARNAMENAKFKIDQNLGVLSAARESYAKASKERQDLQVEITKTIVEMTTLNIAQMNLEQMIPILKKAIAAFNTLRGQFSQLNQFFTTVSVLITDVMGPSVDRLIETLNASQDLVLAGISLSDFTRTLVYNQCMLPLKVATLANKVSSAYVGISTDFILPNQRKVGDMLSFPMSNDEAGKKAALLELQKKQEALRRETQAQSEEIKNRIELDAADYERQINERVNKIVTAMKAVYPQVSAKPTGSIAAVNQQYVDGVQQNNQAATEQDLATPIADLM